MGTEGFLAAWVSLNITTLLFLTEASSGYCDIQGLLVTLSTPSLWAVIECVYSLLLCCVVYGYMCARTLVCACSRGSLTSTSSIIYFPPNFLRQDLTEPGSCCRWNVLREEWSRNPGTIGVFGSICSHACSIVPWDLILRNQSSKIKMITIAVGRLDDSEG